MCIFYNLVIYKLLKSHSFIHESAQVLVVYYRVIIIIVIYFYSLDLEQNNNNRPTTDDLVVRAFIDSRLK